MCASSPYPTEECMSRPGCQVWTLDTLADQVLHVHRHASDVEQAVTLSLMRMLVLNAL